MLLGDDASVIDDASNHDNKRGKDLQCAVICLCTVVDAQVCR